MPRHARPDGAGHRLVMAVACAGLCLLGLTGAAWAALNQDQAPQAPLATEAAAPSHDRPSTSPPSSQPEPVPSSRPKLLEIPQIGVRSSLVGLGLDDQGALEVPTGEDYDRAAWYTGSPTPGQPGPAVIEGHIDSRDGPSVFYDLAALDAGDTVHVTREDDRRATFSIYRVERYHKDTFPTDAVYGNTKGSELRLITCGGQFNSQTGHHEDNTVVYARLVDID